MIMTDHADRKALCAGKVTNEQKVQKAIETMGKHWVLHPANRVKKLAEPLPEVFAWKPAKVLRSKK